MTAKAKKVDSRGIDDSDIDTLPIRDIDEVADRVLPGGRLRGRIEIWWELPLSIKIPWMSVAAGAVGGELGRRIIDALT